MLAAHRMSQLPADRGAEVAFAGRSNAGKSSAINALSGHKSLARTSRTPGRTQQMVVFTLPALGESDSARLVDLPGYGYAKVPQHLREHWKHEMDAYMRCRQSLRGVVLIADMRHPLKVFDHMMLDFCTASHLPCRLLLTKADKLSRNQALKSLTTVRETLRRHTVTAQIFSASTGMGVEEARAAILAFLRSS